MRDINWKINTKRIAWASAILKMKEESIGLIRDNTGPKKDVLATARAAGYLAVKNTAGTIPHCHPLPIEDVTIDFEFSPGEIKVLIEVKTIYKTGCEIEAMHGASIAALTIYDMLKPVDKDIEIHALKLDKKRGGKTDFVDQFIEPISAAVIVCSDSISEGKKEDRAGKAIIEKLKMHHVEVEDYLIIPDDVEAIQDRVNHFCDIGINLIISTGGTGLSPRDNTPFALKDIIETEIPGIMEAARNYGQDRTPYSMLSRGVAGLKGQTLIIALPGSTKGAAESMDALFPALLHIFKVLEKSYKHQDKQMG